MLNQRLRKSNNKGFSLIELLVVVAILAVCCGMIGVSLSIIPAREAKKCANEIDAALSKCKIEAMSKDGGMNLRLYTDAEGNACAEYFANDGSIVSAEKLANSRCTVSATATGASDPTVLDGAGISLSFARGTGAFSFPGTGYESITVTGGSASYTIILVPATGAHYPEGSV